MKAYIAHTSACTGWDLDNILSGTMFKKSGRTWRFPEDEEVRMLDWDFRRLEQKGFDKTWMQHLYLTQHHDFEVVMSPDFFHGEWTQAYESYLTLKRYCRRVVMPIHVPPPDVEGLEIAWPMGVWTKDYTPIWEVQDQVTHLLGGSPHAQLELAEYFPNLRTVDGNQAFWCAARFGKYWDGSWLKPEKPLTNEECFRLSVQNITTAWEEAEKT